MASKIERTLSIQSRHGKDFEAFEDIDPRVPYVVRHKGNTRILSVAIDICISNEKKLCYNNLERGHMLNGKLHKKHRKGGFSWKYDHGNGHSEILEFSPLTLEDFDEHLRQYCTDELSALLQDLDDIQVWYRKQAGIA